MADQIYPATALDDTSPVLPSAVIPPPPPIAPPKQNAASMALNFDGWLESQPKPIQERVKGSIASSVDPELYKRRLINTLFISERTGANPREVGKNYDLALRSYAEKKGWGDVWRDDTAFKGRLTKEVTMERDEQVGIQGRDGDTEEDKQSRAKSLRNLAYFSAIERDDPTDDLTMVKEYAKWQKGAIDGGYFNPANAVKYYSEWSALHKQGQEDFRRGREVAIKALPLLRAATDIGGVDMETVTKLFDGLSPQQITIAKNQISVLQTRGRDKSPVAELGTGPMVADVAYGTEEEKAVERARREALKVVKGGSVNEKLELLTFTAGRAGRNIYQNLRDNTAKEKLVKDDVVLDEMLKRKDTPADVRKGLEKTSKELKARIQRLELASSLRDIGQGTMATFDKSTLPQMGVSMIGESLPNMALISAGPVGWGIAQRSYAYDAENKLIQEGYDRKSAKTLSEFIGAGQAAMDFVSLSLLKKSPGMSEVFNFAKKWTGAGLLGKGLGKAADKIGLTAATASARAAANTVLQPVGKALARVAAEPGVQLGQRFLATTAAETAQELTQDVLVEAAVKQVGNWFDKTLPEVDWRGVGNELLESAPETMFSMMLMSAIGAGIATRSDMKNVNMLANDTKAMDLLGISQERIQQIQQGGDVFSLLRRAYRERIADPMMRRGKSTVGEPVMSPVAALKKAWRGRDITEKGDSAFRGIGASYEWAQLKLEEKAKIANEVAPVTEESDGLFTVEQPDGSEPIVAETADEAVKASIAAFEAKVLEPAVNETEAKIAQEEGRPDISGIDTGPKIVVGPSPTQPKNTKTLDPRKTKRLQSVAASGVLRPGDRIINTNKTAYTTPSGKIITPVSPDPYAGKEATVVSVDQGYGKFIVRYDDGVEQSIDNMGSSFEWAGSDNSLTQSPSKPTTSNPVFPVNTQGNDDVITRIRDIALDAGITNDDFNGWMEWRANVNDGKPVDKRDEIKNSGFGGIQNKISKAIQSKLAGMEGERLSNEWREAYNRFTKNGPKAEAPAAKTEQNPATAPDSGTKPGERAKKDTISGIKSPETAAPTPPPDTAVPQGSGIAPDNASQSSEITPEIHINDPELNQAAGINRIFRDDTGWHLEVAEPEPGQEKIITAGHGHEGLAAALQIRDQMGSANLTTQNQQKQEKAAKEEAVSFKAADGVSLSPELEDARQELEKVAGDILPVFDKVFTGVDVVDSWEGGPTGGFFLNKDTGRLGVSLSDVAREMKDGRVKNKRKWVAAALIEEAIHYLADKLEREGKLDLEGLYETLKEEAPTAYAKFRQGYKSESDVQAKDEFIRAVTQGRLKFDIGRGMILDGELTEMQFSDKLLGKIKKVLKQLLYVIRNLEGTLSEEFASDLKEAADTITSLLESLVEQSKQQNQNQNTTNEQEKDASGQARQGRQEVLNIKKLSGDGSLTEVGVTAGELSAAQKEQELAEGWLKQILDCLKMK